MSSATEVFDPYREWLRIEPHELPADHYRLLGLARFESDTGRIQAAADERMVLIRSNQTGPRGSHAHSLLNEISVAKRCLLSPGTKAEYDKALFARLVVRTSAATAPAPFAYVLPPAYAPYARGVPTLEPPLAAPPMALPLAVPLPPPKPARKSELAVDLDRPPPDEPEVKGSRLRLVAGMFVAVLFIAGVTWGVGKYFGPPAQTEEPINPELGADGQPLPDGKEQPPVDPLAKAIVVMQEANSDVNLPPSAAVLLGGTIVKPAGTENVIVGWTSTDDSAVWKFKLVRPGFFTLELGYAATMEADGTSLELLLDDEPLHKFTLPATGGLDVIQTLSHTVAVKSSGTHKFVVRPAGQVPESSLAVKSIRLVPIGGNP